MSNKLKALTFALLLQLQIAPVLADGTHTPEASSDSSVQNNVAPPADNDQSKPYRAEWEAWHNALAKELYGRIGSMLQKIGPPENERDFLCKLRWRIYRHGRVIPMSIEGTNSQLFRDIVRKAVDSLHSSELINFPTGSKKEYVEKISTFNYWWRNPRPGEGIGDFDSTIYSSPLKGRVE